MAAAVSINQNLCANNNYKKMNCDLCRASCPGKCIDTNLQVGIACNDCGLCQAVCPAEAIFSEHYTGQSLDQFLKDRGTTAILACRKQDEASPWPCLGFLDGTLLLSMARSASRIIVDDRSCSSCKPGVADHLQALLSTVNTILDAGGKTRLQGGTAVAGASCKAKSISRRDFFSRMLSATADAAREVMLPAAGGGERLLRRDWFRDHIDRSCLPVGQVAQSLFHSISITTSTCTACGLCAKICPRHAIDMQERDAALTISHDPFTCTGCRICVAHCPQNALRLIAAEYLDYREIAVVSLPNCSSCGGLYQPVGGQTVCFECLLKSKRQIMG